MFIRLGNRVFNIKYVHSITLNQNGENGWLKVVDEEGYGKYRVKPEEFEELADKLLAYQEFNEGVFNESLKPKIEYKKELKK